MKLIFQECKFLPRIPVIFINFIFFSIYFKPTGDSKNAFTLLKISIKYALTAPHQ